LLDDPDMVILSREIRRGGRNISRINGRMVTASLQREVGEYLVDIHGQSEHLSLLHVRHHLNLLDSFAGDDALLMDYRKSYEHLRQVRQELQELKKREKDVGRQSELLSFQIQEIEAAKLQPEDEEELQQERTRLANAENLANYSKNAAMIIEEGSPEVPPISDLLGEVVEALHNLSRIDLSASTYYEKAQSSLRILQDLSLELENYAENIEFNPRLLDQIEERIDLVNRLKRKYGPSIDSVLAFAQQAKRELDAITHVDEHIQELTAQKEQLMLLVAEKAEVLSHTRQEAAEKLGHLVEEELNDLRMAEARFQVVIDTRLDDQGLPLMDSRRVAFDSTGYDQVEFFVETNPGEGFKPLVKIASGGETSRLMLALKNVLVKADVVPTLIFDEIDQGIGGRVGMIVGEKLWTLSRQHQVMCVTHLPQLAAYGGQHFRVTKELLDQRTHTEVLPLMGEDRKQELAQMFGPISEGTLQSADEILHLVQDRLQHLTHNS
ncbi:MAG: DNA repair protein RecN, partial [Anaerolineales bacterium]